MQRAESRAADHHTGNSRLGQKTNQPVRQGRGDQSGTQEVGGEVAGLICSIPAKEVCPFPSQPPSFPPPPPANLEDSQYV